MRLSCVSSRLYLLSRLFTPVSHELLQEREISSLVVLLSIDIVLWICTASAAKFSGTLPAPQQYVTRKVTFLLLLLTL